MEDSTETISLKVVRIQTPASEPLTATTMPGPCP